ncbi:YgdI/YgdR family lipoprotein [Serratia marcescens]|uniref:YgdI/YgdR family lipoprotein n=1 Tax=Serratia marcescens TaxID=615 RepID=UPI0023B85B9D|nr:YgdI/YgdR family lipoprotein [Serratia marcescens]
MRLSNQDGRYESKRLFAALLAATTVMFIAGCASNQAIKTTDGKTIVTDGKPQVDTDTGLVSYRNAETGKTEQINRDQIANMSELDN